MFLFLFFRQNEGILEEVEVKQKLHSSQRMKSGFNDDKRENLQQQNYLSSRLVVVQVHLASSVAFDLSHIQKLSTKSHSKIDVNWTASPLPWLLRIKRVKERLKDKTVNGFFKLLAASCQQTHLILISILVPMNLVTTTYWDVSTTACCGDCVNNSCICDCVRERCFTWTLKEVKIFHLKSCWTFIISTTAIIMKNLSWKFVENSFA